MNLINDPWIPIRRTDGTHELIAPWQLTETDNPVLALDAPRPDFNGALMQFLIGLLQTAATPENYDKWFNWLEEPPTSDELKERFARYESAFELSGEHGSFMQDFENLESKEWSIEKLIMESPGDNTVKLNKDHFFKRSQFKRMCPSCAATALFTFQLNTQGFGASHRVSLRGKGALTSLVILDTEAASDLSEKLLWVNLWLNVLDEDWLRRIPVGKLAKSLADVFPWMGETRVSTAKKINQQTVYIDDGQATTPLDTERFQVFWPMPCRIKLEIQEGEYICDVCGSEVDSSFSRFKIQKFGVDYVGGWRHPLSPHRFDEQGVGKALRVPTDGLHYLHWLGLVQKTDQQNPALVAERYLQLADRYEEQFRLFSFGYEIDRENKARCWYETTFPLFTIPDSIRLEFAKRIQVLTDAASEFSGNLIVCVKDAWFDSEQSKNKEKKKKYFKSATAANVRVGFYQHTAPHFFATAKLIQSRLPDGTDKEVLHSWHSTLMNAALDSFDYWVVRGDIAQSNPRRVAEARKKLRNLAFSKKIKDALQLPVKEKQAKKPKKEAV